MRLRVPPLNPRGPYKSQTDIDVGREKLEETWMESDRGGRKRRRTIQDTRWNKSKDLYLSALTTLLRPVLNFYLSTGPWTRRKRTVERCNLNPDLVTSLPICANRLFHTSAFHSMEQHCPKHFIGFGQSYRGLVGQQKLSGIANYTVEQSRSLSDIFAHFLSSHRNALHAPANFIVCPSSFTIKSYVSHF